ncbi:hypothetical protein L21SP3_00969 [Sedimentisphaera cyanobacteriorum]|uniref:Glycosyltransferase n=1 Tax=Sedimentisphaera cyanobacteriorum TaxID=1940790 RepID=A0A1Q2HNV2_9BACT|nr:hypothetical protein [Sedimentisphaera cyanobacteriorum]AQQ09169.1 hypothetical protein L21SP3_00969 [Sedimentisphaera cyanobacteriorum]
MSMAVLVPSFDKYSFLWQAFFKLFKEYWPNCRYPVYLGTNYKSADIDWVTDLKIGEDTCWGLTVSKMLEMIEEDYVVIILEDFFIIELVDDAAIESAYEFIKANGIDCLGLHACPKPKTLPQDGQIFGEVLPGEPYRINAQVSIWKKESLLKVLRPNFSPWDFETLGDVVARKNSLEIWGSYKPLIHHEQAIGRGKWFQSIVPVCEKHGINFDFYERGFYEPQKPSFIAKCKGLIKPHIIPILCWIRSK